MRNKLVIAATLPLFLVACALVTKTERIARDCAKKVVKVGVVNNKGAGCGSGAFISRSGIIVTCYHVVNQGKSAKIYIKLDDGRVYRGVVVAHDEKADLALIVTSITDTPYFEFGGDVRRGQQVVAFGSPLGLQHTVSFGWVENITSKGSIIHSAAINPGNSGGPLVDMNGKLVGVNQFTVGLNAFEMAAGMGGAVPVRRVKLILNDLMYSYSRLEEVMK